MAISKKVREEVYQKYDCKCAYCGTPILIKDMQVDHIVAKRNVSDHHLLQGKDINDISNLNPSCRSCNNFKSTLSIEGFRKEISMQIERLRRDKPTFRLAERFGLITCNEDEEVVFHFEKQKKESIALICIEDSEIYNITKGRSYNAEKTKEGGFLYIDDEGDSRYMHNIFTHFRIKSPTLNEMNEFKNSQSWTNQK